MWQNVGIILVMRNFPNGAPYRRGQEVMSYTRTDYLAPGPVVHTKCQPCGGKGHSTIGALHFSIR